MVRIISLLRKSNNNGYYYTITWLLIVHYKLFSLKKNDFRSVPQSSTGTCTWYYLYYTRYLYTLLNNERNKFEKFEIC